MIEKGEAATTLQKQGEEKYEFSERDFHLT